jgi:hypothetical protein
VGQRMVPSCDRTTPDDAGQGGPGAIQRRNRGLGATEAGAERPHGAGRRMVLTRSVAVVVTRAARSTTVEPPFRTRQEATYSASRSLWRAAGARQCAACAPAGRAATAVVTARHNFIDSRRPARPLIFRRTPGSPPVQSCDRSSDRILRPSGRSSDHHRPAHFLAGSRSPRQIAVSSSGFDTPGTGAPAASVPGFGRAGRSCRPPAGCAHRPRWCRSRRSRDRRW